MLSLSVVLAATSCGTKYTAPENASKPPSSQRVSDPSPSHDDQDSSSTRVIPLTEATILFPIAEGKTEEWEQALYDLTGPRYDEYAASRTRFGLTSQITFLQSTPMGDFAVIHMTGKNIDESVHIMSSSQNEWDDSWRELTTDLHGVDFNEEANLAPKVESAYVTQEGTSTAGKPFAFVVPLKEDGADAVRNFVDQLNGRQSELVAARDALSITRESVSLQRSTAGSVMVFFWRAEDPVAALEAWATSTSEFDEWMLQELAAVAAIPLPFLFGFVKQNRMVGAYPRE